MKAHRSFWLVILAGISATPSEAQEPTSTNVAQILEQHDRALLRDLNAYLKANPKADDRDQAYAALFNKAIEHDWFAETEESANRYLKSDPDGPVKSLAQIIQAMFRATSGQFKEALEHYKALMSGLGDTDQEEFAISFTDSFASVAIAAGEFPTARQIYETLQERFSTNPTAREKAERELERLAKVGKPAPAIDAKDLSGKPVSLTPFKGKYVFVDFWATWCSPCIVELPKLQELHKKYGADRLEIISVSLDEARSDVADFVKARKLPWTQLHNGSAGYDLVEAFGVGSIPASFLIDPEGKIIRLDLRSSAIEGILTSKTASMSNRETTRK